jgi:hypothetical protein
MVNGDGGDERGKREQKGRFGMVNSDCAAHVCTFSSSTANL